MAPRMRGRFAPSPTGAMHLGNARTALVAWLAARQANGAILLRSEDLDRARVVAGAEARLMDELRWLGLDWDEGPDLGGACAPYRQSERRAHYDEAVDRLLSADRAFLCACSRADVAGAASAPHQEPGAAGAQETEPRYPGTCTTLDPATVTARARSFGREPVVRFRGAGAQITFVDEVCGPVDAFGALGLDDFVLRRADGTAAYQLAVVVDDGAMRVNHVVRGDDLLRSTPRQIALFRALGLAVPRFAHVPLVLAPGGERLAKRSRPRSIGDLRSEGVSPLALVGALGASLGLCAEAAQVSPADLLGKLDLGRIPRAPVVIDGLSARRD